MSLPNIIEPTGTDIAEMGRKDVSVYFSGKFRQAIECIPERILNMSESELERELGPTAVDFQLRRKFWDAVNEAEKLGEKSIPVVSVYRDACTRQYFDLAVLSNPLRTAWVIRPIVEHQHFYEAINRVALQKILEYVQNNTVDAKLLPSIIKLAETAANRAYGAVAQKMQIQSKNLNIDVTATKGDHPPAPDQGQLTDRVQELQAKLLSQAKDVTPKD